MDTLTQVALGACIAQAGFSKQLGQKAVLVGAVCGLLPDLDFLFSIGQDQFNYLATHRGWSHSVFVLPIIAIPVAWLAMKWALWKDAAVKAKPPENQYWRWYLLCFLALMPPPLLDLFTSYGTQILTPFSNGRFTLDAVAIIDPIYTLPLLIALLIGMIKPTQKAKNTRWAASALVVSSLYLGFGLINSWEARQAGVTQLAENKSFEAMDIRASPTLFNTLLWRVVAKDINGDYAVGFFSTVTKQLIQFEFYSSVQNSLAEKATQTPEGKILHWFSTDMLRAEVEALANGNTQVVLTDMRFGLVSSPAQSFFGANFEFDDGDNFQRAYIPQERRTIFDVAGELKLIWFSIWAGG